MKKIISLVAAALLLNGVAIAQNTSPDESAAITKTALDYIEGWYAGDAARMERALHPELAKRMISTASPSFTRWCEILGSSDNHHEATVSVCPASCRREKILAVHCAAQHP